MATRWRIVVAAALALTGSAGCRGCSRPPAPPTAAEDAAAAPLPASAPASAPVRPRVRPASLPSSVPAVPLSPDAAIARFADRLTRTDAPLEAILRELPGLGAKAANAGEAYLYCRAAANTVVCARLGPAGVACSRAVQQVARRKAGPSGWAMPPSMMADCRKAGFSEEACRSYGAAIEQGDPRLCEKAPPEAGECEALAAGDPALCAKHKTADRSCPAQAPFMKLLRRGVAEVARRGTPVERAVAVGVNSAGKECDALLHQMLAGRWR